MKDLFHFCAALSWMLQRDPPMGKRSNELFPPAHICPHWETVDSFPAMTTEPLFIQYVHKCTFFFIIAMEVSIWTLLASKHQFAIPHSQAENMGSFDSGKIVWEEEYSRASSRGGVWTNKKMICTKAIYLLEVGNASKFDSFCQVSKKFTGGFQQFEIY